MRAPKEIRTDIREHKREMKASGIKIISAMNRVDSRTFSANVRLSRLKLELEYALQGKELTI
jgi:hypothetical protein